MSNAVTLTLKKKRLLVVEDDFDARTIYHATLEHDGFHVRSVGSVGAATVTAKRERPDLVVLDCRLPDGNGLDLLRSWRQSANMRDVPVVVVTAYAGSADLAAASLCGASGVVIKPCSGDALAAYVSRVLVGGGAETLARPQRGRRSSPVAVVFPPPLAAPPLGRAEDGHLQARCGGCLRGSPMLGKAQREASRRLLALGWASHSEWLCPICVDRRRATRPLR